MLGILIPPERGGIGMSAVGLRSVTSKTNRSNDVRVGEDILDRPPSWG